MDNGKQNNNNAFDSIEDPLLAAALNELGRSINLVTTYGKNHPAASKALTTAAQAMQDLFTDRKKISIGAFNGVMTIDEKTVRTVGTLQKSLERRLVRLQITGLKISRGTSQEELGQLTELLAANDADIFEQKLGSSNMQHIESAKTQFQAVHEGQTVANESDLSGISDGGVLVLEDDAEAGNNAEQQESSLHVEQIVAFLKGDIEADEGGVGEELAEAVNDPDKLGRMIMESVAIRQSMSELAGESLNDIILGCLRRTYDGIRKQSAFQSTEGKAELRKALLMLEESLLEKMRGLAGDDNPELDRQIVQAIREMDDSLNFEMAAAQYMEHRQAVEHNKEQLQQFIQAQGADMAASLLEGTGFPGSDWRKIVVESGKAAGKGESALSDGLSTLTTVFEKLERLMKSDETDESQVRDLIGQANDNVGDTAGTTKEKLKALSSTIGGQAHNMSRSELLAALAEVAQELMQPLTAINASTEMMLHGYVGAISDEQKDLLTLSSNSGEHLKYLMDMLIDIVGCPANKGIDNRFHTTSDEVQQMKVAEDDDHLPLNFR